MTSSDVSTIKLLTIGDSGVGKSSLLLRWTNAETSKIKSSVATIGIDFKFKDVTIDGQRVKVQVVSSRATSPTPRLEALNPPFSPPPLFPLCRQWDTAGQERYRTLTSGYYRKAQGVLLVYDVTSRESFENVRNWVNQISLNADANITLYLVGNKMDMTEARVVQFEEGDKLAAEFKSPFKEVSAMDGRNVNEAFLDLAVRVTERLNRGAEAAEIRTRSGSLLGSASSLATLTLSGEAAPEKRKRKCC